MALQLQRIDPWDGDSTSGDTYYGYAAPGTLSEEPNWCIKRKRTTNGVEKFEYPYDNSGYLYSGLIWNNRASYKFSNGGSILFDGTISSNILISNDIDLRFRTGDFTIEWWQYQTDNISYPRVFSMGTWNGIAALGATIAVSIESGRFYFWTGGTLINFGSVGTYKDTWVHFAITRSDSSVRVFKDGVQLGNTVTTTYDFNDSTNGLRIGNETDLTYEQSSFGGYITNFRWIKGTAVYTSNFTRPTSELTATSDTKLLILASTEATGWIDSSTSNKSITNSGTTWNSKTPF